MTIWLKEHLVADRTILTLLLFVKVHLDGMIDNQVSWANGIDFLRISAQLNHRIAHGSEIHHSRYAAVNKNETNTSQSQVQRLKKQM